MSYLLLISLVPKPGTILTPIIIGREIVFDFQNQILLKEETPTLKEAQAKHRTENASTSRLFTMKKKKWC